MLFSLDLKRQSSAVVVCLPAWQGFTSIFDLLVTYLEPEKELFYMLDYSYILEVIK
jgi:hypothetical protein